MAAKIEQLLSYAYWPSERNMGLNFRLIMFTRNAKEFADPRAQPQFKIEIANERESVLRVLYAYRRGDSWGIRSAKRNDRHFFCERKLSEWINQVLAEREESNE